MYIWRQAPATQGLAPVAGHLLTLLTSDDGVLLVDTSVAQMAGKIQAAMLPSWRMTLFGRGSTRAALQASHDALVVVRARVQLEFQ